jgi:radical SAM superfamily enzyme YgiQ (UPF0313 family)
VADIVLCTLNARYTHASFGLRYLYANLGELQGRAEIVEFTISERISDIVESMLARAPRIVGIGVYIWNVERVQAVVRMLRQVAPELRIVLGGPEVSYELDEQPWALRDADVVVTGEGDQAFRDVCERLLAGEEVPDIVSAGIPPLDALTLPYEHYVEEDVAHRVIYVEASRGCPFRCEFCLSSLDRAVRHFPQDAFLAALETLWARCVRQYKFVDRTFNLKVEHSARILDFFLDRDEEEFFAHFEMIPDRLPEELRSRLGRFRPGTLQLEVGIQTFNPQVAKNISRRQNYDKVAENFAFLRDSTHAHVHADLIIGLPGETLESFASGFNQLVEMRPQEIQVGILKRLRGTPIVRHTEAFRMVYRDVAPYDLLANESLDFGTMQRLKRFAKTWDRVANSGNFRDTLPLLLSTHDDGAFAAFLAFSDWLAVDVEVFRGVSLRRLVDRVFHYLTGPAGLDEEPVRSTLIEDYQRAGRSDLPPVLSGHRGRPRRRQSASSKTPSRQARHL